MVSSREEGSAMREYCNMASNVIGQLKCRVTCGGWLLDFFFPKSTLIQPLHCINMGTLNAPFNGVYKDHSTFSI